MGLALHKIYRLLQVEKQQQELKLINGILRLGIGGKQRQISSNKVYILNSLQKKNENKLKAKILREESKVMNQSDMQKKWHHYLKDQLKKLYKINKDRTWIIEIMRYFKILKNNLGKKFQSNFISEFKRSKNERKPKESLEFIYASKERRKRGSTKYSKTKRNSKNQIK